MNIGFFPSYHFFSTCAYFETRSVTSKISIGSGTWIYNSYSAIAEHTTITIGQRVLIGTNVEIFDSDFHGISVHDRNQSRAEWARPVVVEDDVFLGSNVRVLKGVAIGRRSVVANGSLVVNNIPSRVIAEGNPARILRALDYGH